MKKKKWAYKPGELRHKKIIKESYSSNKESQLEQYVQLVEDYSEMTTAKRTIVMNDNKEVVFFVQMNEDMQSANYTDIFLYDGERYRALDFELSQEVAAAYFQYVDFVSEGYMTFERRPLQ